MPIEQDSNDPTGVRGSTETSATQLKRARERKANAAIEMRLAGATWGQIAEALGFPTARQALVATERALEKGLLNDEDRDSLRRLAGQRLDRLLRGVWTKAIDPNNPEHLNAVTKAREIIGQHSKLYGLDAPAEVVVHSPTASAIEEWVSKAVSLGLPQVEEVDIIDLGDEDIDDPDDPDGGVGALVGA